MKKIVPAIIPESFEHLEKTLKEIKSVTKSVQIDVVDGAFVPASSWPYVPGAKISQLKKITKDFEVEIDLMIMHPEEVIEEYSMAGVSKIVVHLESVGNYNHLICLKHEYGFELGLSINNDTPLETLLHRIGDADYVQFMGIAQIGFQGNPFDTRVLERISLIKKTYPELTLAVDGSVNKKTIPKLLKAGAGRFTVGSAILGAQKPKEAFKELSAIVS